LSSLTERLVAICGPGFVSDKLADRICYTRDAGPTPGELPDVIARPRTPEQVSQIILLANEVKKPIFVWGRATTFIGHGIRKGCIIMALDLMNAIENIDLDNHVVTVQTGAVWHAVDVELGKHGWELAVPGPGGMFVCSVGGSVAYNAVPHALAGYGMTGDNVVALEVVLPDGSIIHTGTAANQVGGGFAFERYANGPDLAGLFIGSCGVYGVITKVSYRIRMKPDTERFAFYSFESVESCANTALALQRKQVATHMVGLYGGPKPQGTTGDAFLHIVIRDDQQTADLRLAEAHTICSAMGGRRLDEEATRRYWVEHMYSWLRNTPPDSYYGDRPFTCPEATGFLPSNKVKETIDYLRNYEVVHAAEFVKHTIRIKCYDIYYSRNAAFIWIDTLFPELDKEAWTYGLNMRAEYSEWLYGRFGSPGGILEPLAKHIMPKLGAGFEFMKFLKKSMDPNSILNPGVLMLGVDTDGNGSNGGAHHG
jgi:FAD/FMN-containing dehydrogenase